jgi:5-methylcytosine-specific restriction endonuclease McrA
MKDLTKWINELIAQDALWKFYKSLEWIQLKQKILEENNYECAECKRQGILTRYDVDKDGRRKLISTVHHVQFVRRHPELALSRTYVFNGKTYVNLIPVCKKCHNKLHPEKRVGNGGTNVIHYSNDERW